MSKVLNVGGLLYPGFEMLDLFGPLEMFSLLGGSRVRICTIATRAGPVRTAMGADPPSGPEVLAEYGVAQAPDVDVLIVPGGFGTFPALGDEALLDYLRAQAERDTIVASVCTGAALLAKAGLLDGRRATTNKQFFDLVRAQGPTVDWVEAARWVDAGRVVTSSGVSAGMDMALALIARLIDADSAEAVAVAAEYTWNRDSDFDPFVAHLNAMAVQPTR